MSPRTLAFAAIASVVAAVVVYLVAQRLQDAPRESTAAPPPAELLTPAQQRFVLEPSLGRGLLVPVLVDAGAGEGEGASDGTDAASPASAGADAATLAPTTSDDATSAPPATSRAGGPRALAQVAATAPDLAPGVHVPFVSTAGLVAEVKVRARLTERSRRLEACFDPPTARVVQQATLFEVHVSAEGRVLDVAPSGGTTLPSARLECVRRALRGLVLDEATATGEPGAITVGFVRR